MFLVVMAGAAELDNGRLLHEENPVTGVGRMTDRAGARLYRAVLRLRPFLPFDGVRMTFPAQGDHRLPEERGFFRSMGRVAARTAFLADERPVEAIFIECLVYHRAVASPAQFIARLLDLQRVL